MQPRWIIYLSERSRRMESKKRKRGKGRKNSRWRRRRRNMYRRVLQRLLGAFVLLQLNGRGREKDWWRAEKGEEAVEEDGEAPLSSSFHRTQAGLDICILRWALGSQSSRCVALIPDFATRGMTLTHRRTRRVWLSRWMKTLARGNFYF